VSVCIPGFDGRNHMKESYRFRAQVAMMETSDTQDALDKLIPNVDDTWSEGTTSILVSCALYPLIWEFDDK
jgi:hypothetical protein